MSITVTINGPKVANSGDGASEPQAVSHSPRRADVRKPAARRARIGSLRHSSLPVFSCHRSRDGTQRYERCRRRRDSFRWYQRGPLPRAEVFICAAPRGSAAKAVLALSSTYAGRPATSSNSKSEAAGCDPLPACQSLQRPQGGRVAHTHGGDGSLPSAATRSLARVAQR